MPSAKLTALANLAGAQVPDDLAYIVDVSAGVAGSKKSTLNDLVSIITKNITDGAVRFQGFAAPTVSAAGAGALYFATASNTWKGSRNTGAYQDLLFGTGAVTQIAYWDTPADSVLGSASWTFNNTTKTVTLSHTDNTPHFIIQNTTASTPDEFRVFLLGGTVIQGINFDAVGNGASLNLFGGRDGPLFPLATAGLGGIRFAGVNGGGVGPTTSGGGSISYTATANLSLTEGGSGMTISAVPNGATTDTVRFTITGSGACIVGANGTGPTATLGGTSTSVVLGNLTTYATDGAIQIGNSNTGPTTVKTVVIQANPLQTASILETQSSGGGGQFQVRVSAGNGNHFLSLLGNNGSVPGVSVAAQWRIYCSSGGRLMISENGGAYTQLFGGVNGTTTQVLFNSSGASASISGVTSDGTNITAGSGNLRATSPRITAAILDTNGNELFNLTATASAINEFTVINAATGNSPTIQASGGDTDVSIILRAKGAGVVQLGVPSSETGKLRFCVSGDANATTLQGGDAPASDVVYKLPADDPAASEFLKITSFGSGVAVLEWAFTPMEIGAACSDETTALAAGTAKVTFRMPRAMTLTAVRASLTTAQASGSIFTVDINESGVSILSTKITIDNTEKTSTTAATPPVISDANLADDAEITVDIDQIGNGSATGLKIWLIGNQA